MNEDFLAIIKLISGEEILSTVSYLDDENLLILDKSSFVTIFSGTK